MSIQQCQNGTSRTDPCTGGNWITGNLNRNNSAYREGDFVPFRSTITGLAAGGTYTLQIGYDAVEDGLHAYDYLGTYDASAAPGQQIVPCSGVGGTAPPHACGSSPSTLPVPVDTDTTFPPGSGASQLPGEFSAWGAVLTAADYANSATVNVNTTGTVQRLIDVTFTADGDTVVLAWGGHVASSLDWGAGNTFVGSHSGASFHMRVLSLNGASTGHQDLSLHGDAIAPVPTPFVTGVDRSRVEVGTALVDQATLGGRPGAPVSGDVRFFVCGPAAGTPPDCTFGGNEVPLGRIVTARTPVDPAGMASVQYTPASPGFYCFRAEFVPSATALYSPAAHTNTEIGPPSGECFEAVVTPPSLTLTKICIPPTLGGTWSILLNNGQGLSNVACGATTTITPPAGTYTVTETRPSGSGNFTAAFGGNCEQTGFGTPAWTATITLANGDSKKCTVTNISNQGPPTPTGTLTVNKVCSPDTDPGRFDLHIDGPNSVALRFADVPCGGTTGDVTVVPGQYTVSEANGTDTSLSNYTTVIGGACDAAGSVTVPAAGNATCTISNTRIPPPPSTLTVTKLCVPGNGSQFIITIDGHDEGTLGCGDSTRAVPVSPGLHIVGERGADGTDVSDYTLEFGEACEADGTVIVGVSASVTCTLTNVRKSRPPPTALLAVEKICVPSDDGGLFTLTIDGKGSADQPCGGRLGPVVVSPGMHRVGETAGTRTSLSDYTTIIGGACATDGSVTLAAGDSKTCTITNVRNDEDNGGGGGGPTPPAQNTAQITIVKQCSPTSVRARFQLNLDDHVFQGMKCGQSTGPVTTSTGDHTVGEVAVRAQPYLFRTIITGDCAANGAITLTAGQHATCTVTNVRRAVRPPLRPPAACYRLTVARRMVPLGKRVLVLAHVRLHRRPVRGVRVYAVAHRVFAVRTTGPNGRALFLLRLHRPGILTLRIRRPFGCPKPPPQKIGILGVSQPSLTG